MNIFLNKKRSQNKKSQKHKERFLIHGYARL